MRIFYICPHTHAHTHASVHAPMWAHKHALKNHQSVTNLKAISSPNSSGAHSEAFPMAIGGIFLVFTII